jgi:hypothetical protein
VHDALGRSSQLLPILLLSSSPSSPPRSYSLSLFLEFEPRIRRAHKFRARCETRSAHGYPPPIGGRTTANFARTVGYVPQGAWGHDRQLRIDAEGSRKREVIGGEKYAWRVGDSACTPGLQLEPTSCWTRLIRDGQGSMTGHCQWSKRCHLHRARKGRYPLACRSPCWKHRYHREREYYATAQCHRSFAVACNHYPGDIRENSVMTM